MRASQKVISFILHLFEETKTFGFVGPSGTGKSHRAKAIAEKYFIDLIIDDGLLIKDDRILAGFSAKQEENYLGAVRTAIFDTAMHRNEVINAIQKEQYPRILILGTSVKMIEKIASRLRIPKPTKYIRIEDVATDDEIAIAQKVRYEEGKHIIPVPAIEITRRYPSIAYGTTKATQSIPGQIPLSSEYEKTIVTPIFSKSKDNKLSTSDFRQIVEECISFYDSAIKVTDFQSLPNPDGYTITIGVKIPESDDIVIDEKAEIKHIVVDSLARYAGARATEVNIQITKW